MDQVSLYLHDILDFFRDGIREGFQHVNGVLGLMIALYFAYHLGEWKRIWAVALGATVTHLVAVVMIPFLANERNLQLPPDLLELSYWKTAAALFLGYVIVIAVLFALKTQFLTKSDGEAHAHH
jgi:hypothetical protein